MHSKCAFFAITVLHSDCSLSSTLIGLVVLTYYYFEVEYLQLYEVQGTSIVLFQ